MAHRLLAATPMLRCAAAGATLAAALVSSALPAQTVPFATHDVSSLFSISKSENRNEVVYALRLNERCAPIGEAPVFAFWRMHEKGPGAVEPLLEREQAAYGIARQRVNSLGSEGGSVDIALRAIPNRPIVVQSLRQGNSCRTWSRLQIAGADAYLYNVHVKLKPFGVEYLLLSGWTADGTRVVHEKIER